MKNLTVQSLILLLVLFLSFIFSCKKKPIILDNDCQTITAWEGAQAGDTAVIKGIQYIVVDSAMLYEMVANDEDVTKVITTLVTNMSELFKDKTDFNQDISRWDVSNVTDMSRMFYPSIDPIWHNLIPKTFNQDISCWNVSNVTNMSSIFYHATSFNQDISNWDVSHVTNMGFMFIKAISFNQDLSFWDVSNVTYCGEFSYDTPMWTLPKPHFTSCNPN